MQHNRRGFLSSSLGAAAAGWSLAPCQAQPSSGRDDDNSAGSLHLASFRFDVTPPMGHSLCGGWIKPVEAVDDPLQAIGIVLLGAGKPIVLCAVDWTGLLNEAHVAWRTALAEAAGTTPDRVAVQCVHQHNAPFACLEAESIVLEQGDLPHIVERDFFRTCLDRGRTAVATSLNRAVAVSHVAHGQAKVEKVASNRRVSRDANGHIKAMRGSSCRDETLIALPEGLIDPWLKTVAFYNGEQKVAALHYYATHPMSYYGDGRVTSDFVGLARARKQMEEPSCQHIYFTGCGGNVSAGKYNDGSHPVRKVLTDRIYAGLLATEKTLQPAAVSQLTWRTAEILPPARDSLAADALFRQISDSSNSVVNRNRPSYMLSWLRRLEKQTPIILSALRLGDATLLHLPAECFIEYQLRAQQLGESQFVATAAYGDGGPWYIPVKEEYPNGGYEVSVAFCDPQIDDLITAGMRELLSDA